MFCPKCGKELPDIAKFCGYCGQKLGKSGNEKQNSAKENDLEKKFWKIFVIAVLGCCVCLAILVCFDSFHVLHDWQEATCTEPLICSKCGKIKGEALGHTWKEVTCTQPKTCSVCGEAEGEALGHDWINATCINPQTCNRCHETRGEIGEHELDSTGKCNICGNQVGIALDMSNYRQYLNVTFQLYHDNKNGCGCKVIVTSDDYNVSFQGVSIKCRVEITAGKNGNHHLVPPANGGMWVDVNEKGYAMYYSLAWLDDPNNIGTLDCAEVTDISGFVIK